jgi:hypothetical protein
MFRAHHADGTFWRRGLAVAALVALAPLALPPSPGAAAVRASYGRSYGRSYGPSFRSSHFGISVGDSRFRFHYNVGRSYGFRPYVTSYYAAYPPVFGGLYPYNTGVYLRSFPLFSSQYGSYPWFSSSYPLEPRTVYIYPPPAVRYYGDPAPEAPREKGAAPQPLPHPYDDPVAPSPEKGSLDEALTHIRTSWLREDIDLLTPHLPKESIGLYHDGELRRELTSTEFMRLTREAVRETRTISFRFTEVRRQAADEASATAIHTYVEEGASTRDAQTVTLRYDLIRRNDVWTLRGVYVNPAAGERKP